MRKFLAITGLAFALCVWGVAQTPENPSCPTISISGPSGLVEAGEIATFTAAVNTKGKDYELEYVWSVSVGKVDSGQGTYSIGVRVPAEGANLTVTLEIKGLPGECPRVVSETQGCGLRIPEAVKLGQFSDPRSQLATDLLDHGAKSIKDNPTAQLYILIGHIGGKLSEKARRNQQEALDYLNQKGFAGDQVTVAGVYAEVELMQLWIVPAGADNPRCKECEELEKAANERNCPVITILGPANFTSPGEVMVFEAKITGGVSPYLIRKWTVTGGTMVGGQGTPILTVRTPKTNEFTITATIELVGLPVGCPSMSSETLSIVICLPEAIKVDEYSKISWNEEKKRLDNLVIAASDRPDSKIIAFKYFEKGSKANRVLISKIEQYLSVNKGLPKSSFDVLLIDDAGHTNTRFYLVPPGATNPRP